MHKTKELIMFEEMLSKYSDPEIPEHADEVALKGVSFEFIEIAQKAFDNYCKMAGRDERWSCSNEILPK